MATPQPTGVLLCLIHPLATALYQPATIAPTGMNNAPDSWEADPAVCIGASNDGEGCYTLNPTDVYSGWMELEAIFNQAQVWACRRWSVPVPVLHY